MLLICKVTIVMTIGSSCPIYSELTFDHASHAPQLAHANVVHSGDPTGSTLHTSIQSPSS